jgi:hypothetical protein
MNHHFDFGAELAKLHKAEEKIKQAGAVVEPAEWIAGARRGGLSREATA